MNEKTTYKPETPFQIAGGMIYSLRQDGWEGESPRMVNDVWINIQSLYISQEQRDEIAVVIADALNAAFPAQN